jgi:hypothetical protein
LQSYSSAHALIGLWKKYLEYPVQKINKYLEYQTAMGQRRMAGHTMTQTVTTNPRKDPKIRRSYY